PFGPVPEIGLDCVELVSLTSRLVAGDSIKSLVSTVPYLQMHLAICLFISSIAFLYLWRSRLTSRVNSWNFLSNSSLINFSLTASMDCSRLVSCERRFAISELSRIRSASDSAHVCL